MVLGFSAAGRGARHRLDRQVDGQRLSAGRGDHQPRGRRRRSSSQGYFFSSTGGSPLSCAIGITVLDVLRDEDLQGNASRVGAHLKARLQALRDKHPIIGTVHGIGLYLGVEMVRDARLWSPRPRRPRRSAIACSSSA